MRLADLKSKYEEQPSSVTFDRLYTDEVELGHMFSALHQRLNKHFESILMGARRQPIITGPTTAVTSSH